MNKKSQISDLLNMDVLFGVLIGVIFPFVVFVFMQANAIKEYQSLIAGILALIGAAFALIAVRHQIRHAQEVEDDRIARQMLAARAMMPHALSALSSYARDCCTQLQKLYTDTLPQNLENGERIFIPPDLAVPKIPDAAMATIKECLQFGDSAIQTRLREFIKQLQIQHSRLNGLKKENDVGEHWYYTLISDALEVYARASMLFDYSRGENEVVPGEPVMGDLKSAANNCRFCGSNWAALLQRLERE